MCIFVHICVTEPLNGISVESGSVLTGSEVKVPETTQQKLRWKNTPCVLALFPSLSPSFHPFLYFSRMQLTLCFLSFLTPSSLSPSLFVFLSACFLPWFQAFFIIGSGISQLRIPAVCVCVSVCVCVCVTGIWLCVCVCEFLNSLYLTFEVVCVWVFVPVCLN